MKLFNEKVISDQERDTYINSANSTKANVQSAEAAVKSAEINLGYTKITAPITGIVGIANAQVGDLVGPSDKEPLTAMSQVNPIKATVTVGEQSFTDLLTKYPDSDDRKRHLQGLQFELILGNGSAYRYKGQFYAQDRNIDTKTGAIKVELTFPNPGNVLLPGQFGKVRTAIEIDKGALVIPQDCVTELQGSQMVGVVGSDHTVTMRPVQMGELDGAFWQVLDGVKLGDKVVVQGLMKVRPGMPVAVKDWMPPAEHMAVMSEPKVKKD
jgi:membrane fusion protein (multidrug efflux system)